jgi:toxin-antitoxin system PIN domain toxin
MTVYLLDVNVLLALSWPAHQFHGKVQRWFARNAPSGWATCPMVEASFVRILSNPAFSAQAVTLEEALQALAISTKHPTHRFWADDRPVAAALTKVGKRLVGHQQVTDLYLLTLAQHHRGKLATLDRGILVWGEESSVELIA